MMKEDSKKFVTKEEVGQIWDSTREATNTLSDLYNRVYKYSHWITNLSIGILGFFLATLLQIKSSGTIPYKLLAISALFFCSIAIVIGFYFKIRLIW